MLRSLTLPVPYRLTRFIHSTDSWRDELRRLVMHKSESNAEKNSRRRFIKTAAAGAMAAGSLVRASGSPKRFVLEPEPEAEQQVSANDRIRIGLIGVGCMGFGNTETALRVPGVELVA